MAACSLDHYCHGKATLHSVCIVDLHVNVSNVKVWNAAQKWTLRRIYIAGSNNTKVGVHVKGLIFS
jgi:hypothetical protein